jgi:predicted dehydrogenase
VAARAATALLRELLPQVGGQGGAPSPARSTGRRRAGRALGGGALLDLGCYCIGAARLVRWQASPAAAQPRGEVTARSPGRCTSGVTATFQCSLLAPLVNELEVIGADGVLRVRTPSEPARPRGAERRKTSRQAGNHYPTSSTTSAPPSAASTRR